MKISMTRWPRSPPGETDGELADALVLARARQAGRGVLSVLQSGRCTLLPPCPAHHPLEKEACEDKVQEVRKRHRQRWKRHRPPSGHGWGHKPENPPKREKGKKGLEKEIEKEREKEIERERE